MLRRVIYLLLISTLIGQAAPIKQIGFIEGRLNYTLDTLNTSGGGFTHQERLAWGIQGSSKALLGLNYKLTMGGVLRGNSAFPYTQLTPEYGVRTSIKPGSSFNLALFSYSRLRNPMQVLSDSLELKEFVHGIKLGAQISASTRFSISTGIKSQQIEHRDSVSTNQQFVQVHLDQRLAGMQFRVVGETNAWSRDTLDSRQNTTASVQWYGSPLKSLRWNGMNSLYQANGNNFWRISHRLNYSLSQRQKIWAKYGLGDFVYGSHTLLKQNYDLRYRFQWKPAFGLDIAFKGNRVSVPDSIDIFHWRSYGLSSHWNLQGKGFVRGNLDAGFKESFRYGKGLDFLLNTSQSRQLLSSRFVGIQIRDDLSAEFFQRLDLADDPRYDIWHKLRLTTEFLPENRFRFGNHIRLHNQFGSDLDFSPDTLRNAIIDELYFKIFRQKTQFSIFYRTVYELRDPDNDLMFNLNVRAYRAVSQNLNISFHSMYRFQSEIYSDYLWLSTTLKYFTNSASYALEFQNAGHPENVFKQDSRIWLRFVRQI